MKPNIRVRALLCLMLALLLVIPARIFAQGDETAASLTVSCLENETPIVGAVFDSISSSAAITQRTVKNTSIPPSWSSCPSLTKRAKRSST